MSSIQDERPGSGRQGAPEIGSEKIGERAFLPQVTEGRPQGPANEHGGAAHAAEALDLDPLLDEAVEGSFPASDPPPFAPVTGIRRVIG